MGLGFGEYVQAHTNTKKGQNTLIDRTIGSLSLLPVGNATNDWYFYNLSTNQAFRRAHCTPLPMPDVIINHLNNLAYKEMSTSKRGRTRTNLNAPTFSLGNPDDILLDADDDLEPYISRTQVDQHISSIPEIVQTELDHTVNEYIPDLPSDHVEEPEIQYAADIVDDTDYQEPTPTISTPDDIITKEPTTEPIDPFLDSGVEKQDLDGNKCVP